MSKVYSIESTNSNGFLAAVSTVCTVQGTRTVRYEYCPLYCEYQSRTLKRTEFPDKGLSAVSTQMYCYFIATFQTIKLLFENMYQ